MALKTSFTGKSLRGDLTEAIQDALKKARPHFKKSTAWAIEKTAGDRLELGPISVTIRVGGAKGGGPGEKDPKKGGGQ
jgi:hypothetical protein